ALQRHGRLHFPGKVRILERVRMANAFVGHQLEISSAERVALAGREVREGHPVCPADLGIDVMNLASEAVRRKPFWPSRRHRGKLDRFSRASHEALGEVGSCLQTL